VGDAVDLGGGQILRNKSVPINKLENVADFSEVTALTELNERLSLVSVKHLNFSLKHKIYGFADLAALD